VVSPLTRATATRTRDGARWYAVFRLTLLVPVGLFVRRLLVLAWCRFFFFSCPSTVTAGWRARRSALETV
jgi:hypothetical protein